MVTIPGVVIVNMSPASGECHLSGEFLHLDISSYFRSWVSENEAKVVDSSKLACYINDTNVIGQYILEQSDCSSLSNTLTALTAISDSRVIIDHLPSIIISVSVLIVLVVALSVFIYYRSALMVLILINPIILSFYWNYSSFSQSIERSNNRNYFILKTVSNIEIISDLSCRCGYSRGGEPDSVTRVQYLMVRERRCMTRT